MPQIKHEFRTLFLREFTKELILNSKKQEPKELIIEIMPKAKKLPELPLKIKTLPFLPPKQIQLVQQTISQLPIQLKPIQPQIPQTRPLPAQTKPATEIGVAPISEKEKTAKLNLGKLNVFISDPSITMIECSGPRRPIVIKRAGGIVPTQVSLTKEEIKEIIDTFSQAARIPAMRGVFKAASGDLAISAVISELIGSRFIISKLTLYQYPMARSGIRRTYR